MVTHIYDFDLDKTTAAAWESFTERLDEILSVMDSTGDLNISVVAGETSAPKQPAIRFSVVRDGVVEATLVSEDESGLDDLGWQRRDDGSLRVERDQEHSGELASITTRTMADVFGVLHPVFLEPDQLAELLRGDDDPLLAVAAVDGVVMPAGRAELDAIVDAELARMFGHPPMRDADGDVALRVGSTMIFLRSTPDAREVLLFAALVHDVSGRSRAVEVLNDLNTEARYCRFALHCDRVFVQISVFAKPFALDHLKQALEALATVADAIDDELAARLGGRTTFPG